LKKIQDKKRIARKKNEAAKAELAKSGAIIKQASNLLDDADDSDLLF
jgi:V-type H+-transporting ATPase subunit D